MTQTVRITFPRVHLTGDASRIDRAELYRSAMAEAKRHGAVVQADDGSAIMRALSAEYGRLCRNGQAADVLAELCDVYDDAQDDAAIAQPVDGGAA